MRCAICDRALSDPHSSLAEKLYGEVTPTGRAKAKGINYMRAYGAREIAVGRKAGQFPVTDFTALELRVLALCVCPEHPKSISGLKTSSSMNEKGES